MPRLSAVGISGLQAGEDANHLKRQQEESMPDAIAGVKIRFMRKEDVVDCALICGMAHSKPWTSEDFALRLKDHDFTCRVAVADNSVVGYCVTYKWKDEGAKYHQVWDIAVDAEWRRQGIATKLIQKDATTAKRYKADFIAAVHECNNGAIAFFTAAGFKAVKIERGYFADNRDAFIFRYYGLDPEKNQRNKEECHGGAE